MHNFLEVASIIRLFFSLSFFSLLLHGSQKGMRVKVEMKVILVNSINLNHVHSFSHVQLIQSYICLGQGKLRSCTVQFLSHTKKLAVHKFWPVCICFESDKSEMFTDSIYILNRRTLLNT